MDKEVEDAVTHLSEYKYRGLYMVRFEDRKYRIKKKEGEVYHHIGLPPADDLIIARQMIDGYLDRHG